MTTKNISEFDKCANCGACLNVCPVNAISIIEDGYYYMPYVNADLCINCGKCACVCPVNVRKSAQNLIGAYGGFYLDDKVISESSSGGAFYAIAQIILKKGGIVFGAVFSEDSKKIVFGNTDDVALDKIQKSKYVESNVYFTFRTVKEILKTGRYVLFCGTPCQAAGLKRYLDKDYENLLICDFSCGGLPSHKIYKEYIDYLEKKYGSKVLSVDFRPKNFGWNVHSLLVKFQNGKKYTDLATIDPYYRGFLKSLTKRDYCYSCDFADNHYSDIILADFWLHKKLSYLNNNNKGISLIITNSQKGEQFIEEIKPKMELVPLDIKKASYNIKNGHLDKETIGRHNDFLKSLESTDYIKAINKFDSIKAGYKIKQIFKKIIKRVK